MNKIKILFQQTLMISTGILFIVGIEGLVSHLMGRDFEFAWYHPFSIILTGVLCSVPTVLLSYGHEDSSRRHFQLRVFFHFLSILAIVSIVGRIANWYSNLLQYFIVAIAYFIIYIFVWAATIWIYKTDENKMNQVLEKIRDEE